MTPPTSHDYHADLAAAFLCFDAARASLAKHDTIELVTRDPLRLRYYAPHPLRDDAKPVRPGIYRLNWPDYRRLRPSSTFHAWTTELAQRTISNTDKRFRAIALFNPTLVFETDSMAAVYKWFCTQWSQQDKHLSRQDENPEPPPAPFHQNGESHDTFGSGYPDGFTEPQ